MYVTNSDDSGNPGDDSEDAVSVEGIQAWLAASRHSIATDPRVEQRIHHTRAFRVNRGVT